MVMTGIIQVLEGLKVDVKHRRKHLDKHEVEYLEDQLVSLGLGKADRVSVIASVNNSKIPKELMGLYRARYPGDFVALKWRPKAVKLGRLKKMREGPWDPTLGGTK